MRITMEHLLTDQAQQNTMLQHLLQCAWHRAVLLVGREAAVPRAAWDPPQLLFIPFSLLGPK